MSLRRRIAHAGLAVALAVPALLFVGTTPAAATVTCGDGYHKQSNGLLSGSNTYSNYNRTMTAKISGYVEYCTRERSLRPDQWNQRILIGVPTMMVSHYAWSGSFAKRCMRQSVTVVFAHESQTETVGISGKDPGFSVTFGDSSVTFTRSKCTTATSATFESTGMILTAHNQDACLPSTVGTAMWDYCRYYAPHVDRITINTTTSGTFTASGVEHNPDVTQTETDTSAST